MTDPFSDLERELLGAHARDSERGAVRRRLLPGLPRALAVTASVAAAALGLVWLAGIATEGDPERAAAPQPAAEEGWTAYAPLNEDDDAGPRASCGEMWEPPLTQDPVPAELLDLMAVFRRPAEDPNRALPTFSAQALRIYGAGRRNLSTSEESVYAWAADIVARSEIPPVEEGEDPGRNACEPPVGEPQPGVCLAVSDYDGGWLSACFTIDEIRSAKAFLDTEKWLYGLAPDGPGTVTFTYEEERAEAAIEDNHFRVANPTGGWRGPDAKGEFR